MNSRRIKYLATFGAVLLSIAGISTIVVFQNRIAEARAENASLQATQFEMQRLQTENADLDQLHNINEQVAQLKLANKDLPRLRNQIRQLRGQAAEVAKLQAENEKLLAGQNQAVVVPDGFISKTALRDMGYSSPEATLQTYFYFASRGDMRSAFRCVAGGENLPPDLEQENNRMRQEMEAFPGFAIVEKNLSSPDHAELKVKTSAAGESLTFKFVRLTDGWRMAGN